MSELFKPLKIRGAEFKNRIFVSPMCQYSSKDGMPNDWHIVHLGSRAVGGAALVMTEATAVSPEGRISAADTGIWNDDQAEAFKIITHFIKEHGSLPGIQIAHAGRKASTLVPWEGKGKIPPEKGGWQTLAPSGLPFDEDYPLPKEMTDKDIRSVTEQFKLAAERAVYAGFDVIEIHMAHGYLIHEFLSPLSNKRSGKYGGDIENRMRLPIEIADAVRSVIPDGMPLFARISVTDWVEGGWDLEHSIELSGKLKAMGVDLIDCSSGGLVPSVKIPVKPDYQIPFSEAIKKNAGVFTGGVGLITEPEQAEKIIFEGKADAVSLGREFLRDPYWPLHAAEVLNADINWPSQYLRAKPHN